MRRLLAGHVLRCFCLVGVYETYGGRVVACIDACGQQCTVHHVHQVLSAPKASAERAAAPAGISE